jgi:hypothetical protein
LASEFGVPNEIYNWKDATAGRCGERVRGQCFGEGVITEARVDVLYRQISQK